MLFNWFVCRQFIEVAREKYLRGFRHKETHNSIADYFSGEYHKKYGNERTIPAQPHAYSTVALNLRKLDRLPVSLLETRDFERLRNTLGDLRFIQAKCMAGMGYELLAEATRAVSCAVDERVDNEVRLLDRRFEYFHDRWSLALLFIATIRARIGHIH